MIFQEPTASLNPVLTIGQQVSEGVRLARGVSRRTAWQEAIELLKETRLAEPARVTRQYPHELSGGMNQRVMIAMALSGRPNLLIADEPTTALDVTVQSEILGLMNRLRVERKLSLLLITHDLGVVAEMCERVCVMYAGQIVEQTDVTTLFADPKHPYTMGLIGSIPVLGVIKDKLDTIPGSVPNLINLPVGCRFAPRCQARLDHGIAVCTDKVPELKPAGKDHLVRCWLYHHTDGHTAPLAATAAA